MTLPKFELDPIITERIINLALESENIADGVTFIRHTFTVY